MVKREIPVGEATSAILDAVRVLTTVDANDFGTLLRVLVAYQVAQGRRDEAEQEWRDMPLAAAGSVIEAVLNGGFFGDESAGEIQASASPLVAEDPATKARVAALEFALTGLLVSDPSRASTGFEG